MSDTQAILSKKDLGRKGERRAAKFLKKKGYKILKLNYKTPFGEADIVALCEDTVVFCEVKTRLCEKFGTPAEAVERHKQRRYADIARWFLARMRREDVNVRFDVAEVFADHISHIEGAFGMPEGYFCGKRR